MNNANENPFNYVTDVEKNELVNRLNNVLTTIHMWQSISAEAKAEFETILEKLGPVYYTPVLFNTRYQEKNGYMELNNRLYLFPGSNYSTLQINDEDWASLKKECNSALELQFGPTLLGNDLNEWLEDVVAAIRYNMPYINLDEINELIAYFKSNITSDIIKSALVKHFNINDLSHTKILYQLTKDEYFSFTFPDDPNKDDFINAFEIINSAEIDEFHKSKQSTTKQYPLRSRVSTRNWDNDEIDYFSFELKYSLEVCDIINTKSRCFEAKEKITFFVKCLRIMQTQSTKLKPFEELINKIAWNFRYMDAPLVISKISISDQKNILLPEYQIEITLPLIEKGLYLLFMHYPNGILDICNIHKKKLSSILRTLDETNTIDDYEALVNEMLDFSSDTFQSLTDSIQECFMKDIDLSVVNYYKISHHKKNGYGIQALYKKAPPIWTEREQMSKYDEGTFDYVMFKIYHENENWID